MSVIGRHLCVCDVELDRHRRHVQLPGQVGAVGECRERSRHVADRATRLAENALQPHRGQRRGGEPRQRRLGEGDGAFRFARHVLRGRDGGHGRAGHAASVERPTFDRLASDQHHVVSAALVHDRPHARTQSPRALRVGVVAVAPAQRLGEVVVTAQHVVHDLGTPSRRGAAQRLASTLQSDVGKAIEGGVERAAGREVLQGEAPNTLEQPVARRRPRRVGDDQRRMHQLVYQHVEAPVVVIEAREATGGAAIERSDVHGEVVEQLAFVGAEEVIRPSDRLGHAPVTCCAAVARPIEHVGALTQPIDDLGRAHRARSCRGDLEREGESVEPPAQVDDGVEVGALDVHTGVAGAFEEQLDSGAGERIEGVDGGHLERSQGHDRLARQLQRRPAGGEHRG